MKQAVTILGSGAWGCALAEVLAHRGNDVLMWCRESAIATEIATLHTNSTFLHGLTFHEKIKTTTDLKCAAQHSDLIFEAIPVAFLQSMLEQFKPFQNNHRWVILSKGIEQNAFFLPSHILDSVLGSVVKAILSGPTYARDLIERHFSAAILASHDELFRSELIHLLASHYFHLVPSRDLEGVQIAGAIKNVLALAIGIARGAGCKDNTLAFMMTAGMEEIAELIEFFGGDRRTTYGLAGLGDALLTCMGSLSKNQRAGVLFGQGKTLAQVNQELTTLPEGVNTAQALVRFMEREGLHFPILAATYHFIFEGCGLDRFFKLVLK